MARAHGCCGPKLTVNVPGPSHARFVPGAPGEIPRPSMTWEEARALTLSFPEVSEDRDRRDGAIFRVRRKFFTRFLENGECLLVSRVPFEERELLAELD